MKRLILLVALLPGAPAPAPAQENGRGHIGEWTVLWRGSGLGEEMNRFRESVADDVDFPIRARSVHRPGEDRLVFFDRSGNVDGEIRLRPGERAMAAEDGSAHVVWVADPVNRDLSHFRYYRQGNPEPDWEATAPGEPVLIAPDGSFFVIAARNPEFDGLERLVTEEGGTVQIVGAEGDVRGELPFHPTYCALARDGTAVAMLHLQEVVVLGADGRLDWNARVPIDALIQREGRSQLEAAGGYVVACGTGEGNSRDLFRAERRGTIAAFRDDGTPLWTVDQPKDEQLWFQLTCSIAPDGSTLATFHSDAREIVIQVWDMETGVRLWRRSTTRQTGGRCLSVAPFGELVVLTHGDFRTRVQAWDREGTAVWEGVLPFASRTARIGPHRLLSAANWIVQLTPEWPQ